MTLPRPKIVHPPIPNLLTKAPPPDPNSFRANVRNFVNSLPGLYATARHDYALGSLMVGHPANAADLIYGTPQASRYTPEATAQLRNLPVIPVAKGPAQIFTSLMMKRPDVAGLHVAGTPAVFIRSDSVTDPNQRNRIINHEVAHYFDLTAGGQKYGPGHGVPSGTYSSNPTFQKFTSAFPNNSPFPTYGKGNALEQYAQFTEQPEMAKALLGQDISGMFPYYKPDAMRGAQGRANYMPIGPALSPTSGERPNANFTSGRTGFVFKQTYKPPARNVLQENKTMIQPQWAEANVPRRRKAGFNIR